MQHLYIFILVFLMSGCVGTSKLVYSPVDSEKRQQQSYKGTTSISYGTSLAEAGALNISAGSPDGENIQLGLQISIKKGSTIKFEKWQIALSSPEFEEDIVIPIESLSLSVYGHNGAQGYKEHIYSGEAFFGRAVNEHIDSIPLDSYITLVTLKRAPPKKLIVKMPIFIANEKVVSIAPIVFELIKVKSRGYSMQ